MSLLEVSGLSKRFGGLQAVGGLDLSLAQGEMLGMIGPNGAGKTTVFNLLSGFLASDAGEVRFHGRRLHGCGIPDVRDHGTVVIGIRGPVQDLDTLRRDGVDQRAHLREVATFGEVGNCLEHLDHEGS